MSEWLPLTINVVSVITVAVGVAKYWYLGYGNKKIRRVCEYQILGSVLQMAYNWLIITRDPALWGSMLYQPVLVWSIFMSFKGWHNVE